MGGSLSPTTAHSSPSLAFLDQSSLVPWPISLLWNGPICSTWGSFLGIEPRFSEDPERVPGGRDGRSGSESIKSQMELVCLDPEEVTQIGSKLQCNHFTLMWPGLRLHVSLLS